MKREIDMCEIEGWVDIHNHILPGVDDGAKDWEMSKKMLKMAYEEGFRRMIITPHYHKRFKKVPAEELMLKFKKLQEISQKIDRSFELYLGNELFYCYDAVEWLEQGLIQTMAGSTYILVEFSPSSDFSEMRQGLQRIQMGGYSPILAHMERYSCLYKEFGRVRELYNMGIYLQVNAGSIMGNLGFGIKQFLKKLLQQEYIHFVATDAHNLGKRTPEIAKCARFLLKKYDTDYIKQLLCDNPMKVINNEYI